jgi:hypothetical protein
MKLLKQNVCQKARSITYVKRHTANVKFSDASLWHFRGCEPAKAIADMMVGSVPLSRQPARDPPRLKFSLFHQKLLKFRVVPFKDLSRNAG